MAGFDPKKYRNDVLKPYSKGEGFEQLRDVLAELQRDPQSSAYARLDLNKLYDVPNPVTSQELTDWRKQVVPALNKAAQALPSARLLKALLETLEQQGQALVDPAFWGRLQSERQKLIRAKLEAGLRQLTAEYPLGVVSREELISRLETIGITGVTEESIISVAEQQGLKVYAALQLPTTGVPEKLKSILRDVLRHPEYRSVVDLLLLHRPNEIKDVRFLDRLTVGGTAVSLTDIEDARLRSEQGQDTDALQDAQKFLGAVKDNLTAEIEIHHLVFTTVVELAGTQLDRGKPKLEVRDSLVRLGLNADDASRLVSALSISTASGPRIGVDTVREKLSLGQLGEAQRTLTAISPADGEEQDYANLQAQIERLLATKKQLLEAYHLAVAARDFPAALTAVKEAMRIDQADDSLASLSDLLPPAAPSSLSLRADGPAVVLSWAQGLEESLVYTVVRAEGRIPKTAHDGSVVADGIAETRFIDKNAPSEIPLGYSIFSSRAGRLFSDPRGAEITVLPAPMDVVAAAYPTGAVLSWARPSNTAGIVVTQLGPDGRSFDSELPNSSSFRATGLNTGASYRFSVRAFYLLANGRKFSDSVSITVVPRGEASAVHNLSVKPEPARGNDVLRATWSSINSFDVELWQFPRLAELSASSISAQQIRDYGGRRITPLPGSGNSGGETFQLFNPPAEIIRLVTLTVTDEGFLIGNHVLSGSAPQPTAIVAEPFGEDLRLSWEWPQGDYVMEVAWEVNGRPRTRRVTRARYRAEGGVKIGGGATATNLTIATVTSVDDETWTSPPLAVNFSQSQTLGLRYQLRIKRSLTGKVKCELSVEAESTGHTVPATLILKHGSIMPLSSEDGLHIESLSLDFSSGTSAMHEVTIGKVKSPFWLSLFADDNEKIDLIAPPTSQLKG